MIIMAPNGAQSALLGHYCGVIVSPGNMVNRAEEGGQIPILTDILSCSRTSQLS